MKSVVADSLAKFVKVTGHIREHWSPGKQWCNPWFRGHEEATWLLRPSAYRYARPNEDELRLEFKLRAVTLLDGARPSTDWGWYFLMQHYGLPTRLLDWTDSSILALFFAVRTKRNRSRAAVWALDPWALNENAIGKGELLLESDAAAAPYLPPAAPSSTTPLPRPPIAVQPAHGSTRMFVQRSRFTIHGARRAGFRAMLEGGSLIRILIPGTALKAIRNDLRTAGVFETTVFPDLDGLCREIKDVWVR